MRRELVMGGTPEGLEAGWGVGRLEGQKWGLEIDSSRFEKCLGIFP